MYETGMEEDGFSTNSDNLPNEPNGRNKTREGFSRDYTVNDEKRRDTNSQNYDSEDSDDYAESDN